MYLEKKRRILILGATGFIGQCLLHTLRQQPRVTVHWTTRGCHHTSGSPTDRSILVESLSTMDLGGIEDYDTIVDLVSYGRGRLGTAVGVLGRVHGHCRLIDELQLRGWDGQYIYLSSGGLIYGASPPPLCDESAPVGPIGDYGLEKAIVELHLRSASALSPIRAIILRVANAYGENQLRKPGFGVIPSIVASVKNGTSFQLYGDGNDRRDYVHVNDVVDAISAAMAFDRSATFNISSAVGTSVWELLRLCGDLAGRPIDVQQADTSLAEPKSVVLSNTRALQQLGWKPRISLKSGLMRVLKAHNVYDIPTLQAI